MKILGSVLRALALVLLVPIGLFLGAAAILSHLPVNAGWRAPPVGTLIYVQNNGVHTGIILPVDTLGIDWRRRVRPADAPGHDAPKWLAFGWGDRNFYLNTPTWGQFKLSYGLTAATGLGDSLVHVDLLDHVTATADTRPVRLTPAQYRQLAAYIDATFAARREVIHGYGADDVFYAANGHYSALRTCNVWTSDALTAAGIAAPFWSPFADGVMRWIP